MFQYQLLIHSETETEKRLSTWTNQNTTALDDLPLQDDNVEESGAGGYTSQQQEPRADTLTRALVNDAKVLSAKKKESIGQSQREKFDSVRLPTTHSS